MSVDVNNVVLIELFIDLDGTEQLGGTIEFDGDFQVNSGLQISQYRVEITRGAGAEAAIDQDVSAATTR